MYPVFPIFPNIIPFGPFGPDIVSVCAFSSTPMVFLLRLVVVYTKNKSNSMEVTFIG